MDLDENPEIRVTSSLLWLQRDLISISLPTTTLSLKITANIYHIFLYSMLSTF